MVHVVDAAWGGEQEFGRTRRDGSVTENRVDMERIERKLYVAADVLPEFLGAEGEVAAGVREDSSPVSGADPVKKIFYGLDVSEPEFALYR